MRGQLVYLSGAIEAAEDGGTKWRETLVPKLKSLGYWVINPIDVAHILPPPKNLNKVSNPGEFDDYLRQIAVVELNLSANCDIMVAKIDKNVLRGCGTYCEIGIAWMKKKHIILWIDGLTRETTPGFILGLYDKIVWSEEELLQYLAKKQGSKE